jgi:4-hydroxybutyrate CoA-transferase
MSQIVSVLKPGVSVVIISDIHFVVTEFGVAQFYGKSLHQRARALIDIAHPQFREAW